MNKAYFTRRPGEKLISGAYIPLSTFHPAVGLIIGNSSGSLAKIFIHPATISLLKCNCTCQLMFTTQPGNPSLL